MNQRLTAWKNTKTSDLKYKLWLALDVNHNILANVESENDTIEENTRNFQNNLGPSNSASFSESLESHDSSDSMSHNNSNLEPQNDQIEEDEKNQEDLNSSHLSNSEQDEIEILKHPQNRPLNSVHLEIWKDLFNQNSIFMFELWFKHFSFIERVQIWNSVSFANKFFISLLVENQSEQEEQNLDKLDQKTALNEMSDLELKEFVDIIFKEYKVIYQSIDQSTKLSFKSLFNKCK